LKLSTDFPLKKKKFSLQ